MSGRWLDKPTIAGGTITLRPIVADDWPFMWEMVNDEEGNDLTATTETISREQVIDWCATRVDQADRLDLAIIEDATGEWAGEVVLNEYEPDRGRASFRISLRGPAWFGRGLGTEATKLIVAHGLRDRGLECISLEVLARNPRAARAYEKAGFVETRRFAEDGEDWVEMEIRAGGPAEG